MTKHQSQSSHIRICRQRGMVLGVPALHPPVSQLHRVLKHCMHLPPRAGHVLVHMVMAQCLCNHIRIAAHGRVGEQTLEVSMPRGVGTDVSKRVQRHVRWSQAAVLQEMRERRVIAEDHVDGVDAQQG